MLSFTHSLTLPSIPFHPLHFLSCSHCFVLFYREKEAQKRGWIRRGGGGHHYGTTTQIDSTILVDTPIRYVDLAVAIKKLS